MGRYRKASVTLLTGLSLATLSSPLMTHAAQASATATASPWTIYTVATQADNTGVSQGNDSAASEANYLVSINGETGAMESSVPFIASGPRDLLIGPDRSRAYVLSNDPYITVFHLTDTSAPSRVELNSTPRAIAIAPDGTVYVTVGKQVLSIKDLAYSDQAQIVASLSSPAYGIAVSPDGKTLYVATASTDTNSVYMMQLVPIDIASETSSHPTEKSINLGTSEYSPPVSVNLSSDGKTAYVDATQLEIVNLQTGTIKNVNMEMSGGGPMPDVVIDPRGQVAYALNPGENELSSLNLKTGHTDSVFMLGDDQSGATFGMAMTPDGSRLYVSAYADNFNNWDDPPSSPIPKGDTSPLDRGIQVYSSPISGPSDQYWLGSIPHGPDIEPLLDTQYPWYTGILAVAPDQAPTASLTVTRAPVGQATVFDASSSYGDSPIKTYAWNFGDGTTSVSGTPVVRHTYRKVGTYTVTLKETDAAGASVNNPPVFNGQTAEVNQGSATAETILTVRIASEMILGSLPFGRIGQSYHAKLTVAGGSGLYHWRITGSLPPALTFNSETGVYSGTPKRAGSWPLTIRATDAHGVVSSSTFTISILPADERAISVNGSRPVAFRVVLQKDPVHKDLTAYAWLSDIKQDLSGLGIQSSLWDGKTLNLIMPNTTTVAGSITGTYPYSIRINGLQVEAFPNAWVPNSSETFPLYYLMEALKHVRGLKQTWDGTTWSITTS